VTKVAGGGGGDGRIRDGQGLLLPSREQIDDEHRATVQMDPPRWAADRGRRRRIHEGEGLLIPSRERIDGGWGRRMAPDDEGGGRIRQPRALIPCHE